MSDGDGDFAREATVSDSRLSVHTGQGCVYEFEAARADWTRHADGTIVAETSGPLRRILLTTADLSKPEGVAAFMAATRAFCGGGVAIVVDGIEQP